MKRYGSQIAAMVMAALITLYFWLKWWVVVLCLFVLLSCLIWYIVRRRRTTATQIFETKSIKEENPVVERQKQFIERRKTQGEAIRTLSFIISSQNKSCNRVINHLLDWHLEYSRNNMIYHTDLYDYLIDCAQQRLKTAKADYLKHELRLAITVVRKFMRGNTPEQVADWIMNDIAI